MIRRRRRSRQEPGDEDEGAIDIIPLIDVMFLLLCFFIFITLAMVMQEGMSVELAAAKSGKSVQDQEPLVITVKKSGAYFLNKNEIKETSLLSRLKTRAERNPNQAVFINADRKATHDRVITALDMVRRAGLSNVTFTVEPAD